MPTQADLEQPVTLRLQILQQAGPGPGPGTHGVPRTRTVPIFPPNPPTATATGAGVIEVIEPPVDWVDSPPRRRWFQPFRNGSSPVEQEAVLTAEKNRREKSDYAQQTNLAHRLREQATELAAWKAKALAKQGPTLPKPHIPPVPLFHGPASVPKPPSHAPASSSASSSSASGMQQPVQPGDAANADCVIVEPKPKKPLPQPKVQKLALKPKGSTPQPLPKSGPPAKSGPAGAVLGNMLALGLSQALASISAKLVSPGPIEPAPSEPAVEPASEHPDVSWDLWQASDFATAPTASTPAASTPAASTPAASTPSASTPSASTPAAPTPAAPTPAAPTPAAPETAAPTPAHGATVPGNAYHWQPPAGWSPGATPDVEAMRNQAMDGDVTTSAPVAPPGEQIALGEIDGTSTYQHRLAAAIDTSPVPGKWGLPNALKDPNYKEGSRPGKRKWSSDEWSEWQGRNKGRKRRQWLI